ncbi:MAG TPA: TonB-dependent receptor [Steroidobacteraceae bacterium]
MSGNIRRNWLVGAVALCAGIGPVAAADSDGPSIGDLKQLNVEDLMNLQVTSVARHAEKLIEAASAIEVITQEDIRRSGATSIPEALRLADNLQVAQKNSHDWAISARGFNTNLGNKLLVMIDGRTVYTPLYSGVFWDAQDYLLEDIDRIEVISGPGGALWGANAVNGVINIITKKAKDTQGIYAEGGGGSQPQEFGAVRYGGALGVDTQFRVYAKYFDRGDEVLANGNPEPDAWRQGRVGFRLDSQATSRDRVTLQGDYYDGHENVQTGGTGDASGQNLLGRWTRTLSDESDLSLQSYIDQTHLADPFPPLAAGTTPLTPPGVLYDDLTTYDVDFQHRFPIGTQNRVVWGLGYRLTHDAVIAAPAVGFLPPVLRQNLYSAFIQDEIALRKNLSFTLGTKLEHNDYTGFEFEPSARLSWTLNPNQALWSAISRAVRTPSRIDHDLSEGSPPYFVILKGSADFTSESLLAYEVGYRAQLSSTLSTSVSTFYNQYDDVRSTSITPVTLLPFFFANNLEGHTYGVEWSGDYQISEIWSLHVGYNLLREHLQVKPGQFDLAAGRNETADPEHQFSIRSAITLPRHVELAAGLRWVDTLQTNNGPTAGSVPAYFELESRVAWHASNRLELSLVGQNLLHNHHPEYAFPDASRPEIERSVYGKFAWRY